MTTELQTQSNRRNAQHSTGPVSEAGRARSARNALKHGYCATDIVMPGEDTGQFERLLSSVQADWAPESDPERELTDEIAVARHPQRRTKSGNPRNQPSRAISRKMRRLRPPSVPRERP